jgi:hypothetical protein
MKLLVCRCKYCTYRRFVGIIVVVLLDLRVLLQEPRVQNCEGLQSLVRVPLWTSCLHVRSIVPLQARLAPTQHSHARGLLPQ